MTGDAAVECRVGLGRPGDEVPRRRDVMPVVGEFKRAGVVARTTKAARKLGTRGLGRLVPP